MIKITDGKGFHITFDNGWTVSVQFGPANYCGNYDMEISREGDKKAGEKGSQTAEIAAWDKNHNWYNFGGDKVEGHQDADNVLAFMNMIAAL